MVDGQDHTGANKAINRLVFGGHYGKKYFSQGYTREDNVYVFELQLWEPKVNTLWQVFGKGNQESYEQFSLKNKTQNTGAACCGAIRGHQLGAKDLLAPTS